MEYWKECIEEGLSGCGLKATPEQVVYLAETIDGAFENYGMATGNDVASANFISDDKRKLDEMQELADKKREWKNSTDPCPVCHTSTTVKDGWGRDTQCDNCTNGRVNKRY